MNVVIGTVLTVALVASLGWWLGVLIAVWNTRPMSMYDTKLERWRAHSLLGTPWRTKRHGVVVRKPLERRRPHVITLEHPVLDPLLPTLEQPPTQKLDITA